MILGRDGIAYEHSVLFPGKDRDKDAEEAWFDKAREQADATGRIKVAVPTGLLKGWKAEAQAIRGRER